MSIQPVQPLRLRLLTLLLLMFNGILTLILTGLAVSLPTVLRLSERY